MRARVVGKKSPAIQRDNVLGNPLKMFRFPGRRYWQVVFQKTNCYKQRYRM